MSSHWRSSRWSSAREREAKERARAEEKDQARRSSTPGRTRKTEPAEETKPGSELSDLISSSAKRPRTRKWPYPEEEKPPEPAPEPALTRRRSRRRSSSASAAGDGGPRLPNLPDEPITVTPGGRGGGQNRLLIFGLVLFVLMGFIAINPGDVIPGIGDDTDPTPTEQSMIVPTAMSTQTGVQPEATTADAQPDAPSGSRGEIVCIDAGHGGWDTGFTREANERAPALEEADINLAMSYMLKEKLEAEGFTVVLTRPSAAAVNIWNEDINGDGRVASDVQRGSSDQNGDRDELQARINICNEAQADILISLHINGFTEESARGYEVIYTRERPFGQQSADLAFDIYDSMTSAFEEVGFVANPRGAIADSDMGDTQFHEGRVEDHYVMTGPAVNAPDFSIVPSEMPAVIVEAGFISNDADAAFLADPANQQVIVDAYVAGIIEYFDKYPGHFERG
jgi:N-acetylmuramoyl-L-alanine amidase